MNYPAASSGVSMQDTINFNVASDGVLDPSFAINRLIRHRLLTVKRGNENAASDYK